MTTYLYFIEAILLLAMAVSDLRTRQIPLWQLCLLALSSGAGILLCGAQSLLSALMGASIGLALTGVALLTREQIGMGDALTVTFLGSFLGWRACLILLFLALACMWVLALFLLITKKGSRKSRLPFLPALWLGYLISVVCLA